MPSILHTVRDLGRLREIAGVLARHGFEELVQRTGLASLVPGRRGKDPADQRTPAERIRTALEELGPSFVKLGQIASTRPDLIPADIIEELQKLQDAVPPVPFEDMQPEIERQLGAPIAEVYSHFDTTPLASASIGQVYRARLVTDDEGEVEVVVKAQRPGIGPTIDRDIDLLYWLAHAIERSMPETAIYRPVRLVDEFQRAISAELDYAQEADNAERFAENFRDLDTVMFPKVYRQACSRSVLTLAYIPGDKVFTAVEKGASGELIAKNAVQVIIRMIFEHGFFHADPHPGNVLITGDAAHPVLGLVDLGQVGRLMPRARDRLMDLLLALAREDHRAVADALYAISRPTKKIDRAAYEAHVSGLMDRYLGKRLGDVDIGALLRDVVGGAVKFGVEVPSELLMVGKAIMTVEGIGRQIYPQLDLTTELRPYFTQLMGYRYSPEKLTGELLHLASRFSSVATEFPAHAEEILEDIRLGRLSIEVRQPSITHAAERLGRRIFAGAVVGSMLLAGAGLLAAGQALVGSALLGAATLWTFLHGASLALTKNRPPR